MDRPRPVDRRGRKMSLVGTTTTGGNDTAILFSSTGVEAGMVTNDDNVVNLPEFWADRRVQQFSVTIVATGPTSTAERQSYPERRLSTGARLKPNCKSISFTGETNNLSFGPTPPAVSPPGPASFSRRAARAARRRFVPPQAPSVIPTSIRSTRRRSTTSRPLAISFWWKPARISWSIPARPRGLRNIPARPPTRRSLS